MVTWHNVQIVEAAIITNGKKYIRSQVCDEEWEEMVRGANVFCRLVYQEDEGETQGRLVEQIMDNGKFSQGVINIVDQDSVEVSDKTQDFSAEQKNADIQFVCGRIRQDDVGKETKVSKLAR